MYTSNQSNAIELVPDSFQSFLVRGAHFTDKEEYPILPASFISSVVPEKIMPFSKAITYRGDLHDTFIGFYSPDDTFERVRRNQNVICRSLRELLVLLGRIFQFTATCP